jgi:aquaporin Z
MEAAGLGLFMLSACFFTALLEHPGSPAVMSLQNPFVRRALIGLAMGLTAVCLIYSPWGKQSGAHYNPAVTLTFFRLGKVAMADAAFYVIAQFLGGALGVGVAANLARAVISHPAVHYVATKPGERGVLVAALAELAITFVLMTVILRVSNTPRLARFTGLFAGALVALYITAEAPLSGMSMNPARSFASALVAQDWSGLWIYFAAPPLGMLLAAELFIRQGKLAGCAKLHHENPTRCIFCGRVASAPRDGGRRA